RWNGLLGGQENAGVSHPEGWWIMNQPTLASASRLAMPVDTTRENAVPQRRVILLGASNLTRGISTVVETEPCIWGRPLDILAAFGHGRSYGSRRWLLGRELPGIVECGLWQALEKSPPAPTAALITDIGNDVLYEEPVDTIVSWVEWCLDQ